MTDDRSSDGRLDLRALDAAPDNARREAVIAAVMSLIAAGPRRTDDVTKLLRLRRRMVAVTAALAGLAAVALLAFPSPRRSAPAEDPVLTWVQASHVPTNAELLATFQGYAP